MVVSITLIATAAPIATSLPAADAFELRLESRSSVAVIDAAPVTVERGAGAEVRVDVVADDRDRDRRADRDAALGAGLVLGLDGVVRGRPRSSERRAAARRSRRPRSPRGRCRRRAPGSETEAPMPTLPLFASESAFAGSSSLLCAFSVTSPVPAVDVRAGRDDRLGVVRDDVERERRRRSRPCPCRRPRRSCRLGVQRRAPRAGRSRRIAGLAGSAVPSPDEDPRRAVPLVDAGGSCRAVTAAPSAGVPVQPVTPVNVSSSLLPVYEHVPGDAVRR